MPIRRRESHVQRGREFPGGRPAGREHEGGRHVRPGHGGRAPPRGDYDQHQEAVLDGVLRRDRPGPPGRDPPGRRRDRAEALCPRPSQAPATPRTPAPPRRTSPQGRATRERPRGPLTGWSGWLKAEGRGTGTCTKDDLTDRASSHPGPSPPLDGLVGRGSPRYFRGNGPSGWLKAGRGGTRPSHHREPLDGFSGATAHSDVLKNGLVEPSSKRPKAPQTAWWAAAHQDISGHGPPSPCGGPPAGPAGSKAKERYWDLLPRDDLTDQGPSSRVKGVLLDGLVGRGSSRYLGERAAITLWGSKPAGPAGSRPKERYWDLHRGRPHRQGLEPSSRVKRPKPH